MKYPKLVRQKDCKIPCRITFYTNNITEDGDKEIAGVFDVNCNYQDIVKNINTDTKSINETTGKIYLRDDIIPGRTGINDGVVEIFGEHKLINYVMKARNPDGTVNYLCLEVR